jgi:hypothetical protein
LCCNKSRPEDFLKLKMGAHDRQRCIDDGADFMLLPARRNGELEGTQHAVQSFVALIERDNSGVCLSAAAPSAQI